MRAILAAVVGAVVLFIWGAVFWMGLFWFFGGFSSLEPDNEQSVVAALQVNMPHTGVYEFPSKPTHDAGIDPNEAKRLYDDWVDRYGQGPVGSIVYVQSGQEVSDPVTLVRGFVIELISSILVCMIVILGGPAGFAKKWVTVAVFGIAASVAVHLISWNFRYTPTNYTLMLCFDTAAGWMLAGIPIAAILPSHKPKQAA